MIVRLLSDERANFTGQHFTLTDAWCEPKPVQRPHPPIAIGGNGEKRTLRVVARFAQHWNSTLGDVGAWQAKGEVLDRHCADVGATLRRSSARSTFASAPARTRVRSRTTWPAGATPAPTSASSTSTRRTMPP